MEVMKLAGRAREADGEGPPDAPLDAFRATDAFACAAARAAAGLTGPAGEALRAEVFGGLLRCGAGLLLASESPRGSGAEVAALEGVARALARTRYALYLARRLGTLDVRCYRSLAARRDAAAREVRALRDRAPGPRAP